MNCELLGERKRLLEKNIECVNELGNLPLETANYLSKIGLHYCFDAVYLISIF